MTGNTLTDTKHGESHCSVVLPRNTSVVLRKATNLPESSDIKYWVRDFSNPRLGIKDTEKLLNLIDSIGVGLHEEDVQIHE